VNSKAFPLSAELFILRPSNNILLRCPLVVVFSEYSGYSET